MSDKELKRRKICRAVFNEGWKLKKRTNLFNYSFSLALKLAWRTVRYVLFYRYSKVKGVCFKDRQKLLQRLAAYDSKNIILTFQREPDNIKDPYAVAKVATVRNKGSAVIGYVSKEISAKLAPLLDSGKEAIVIFEQITGGSHKARLGCNYKCLIF